MQDYFYSDKLDLLKWGALVSIAKTNAIPFILQVPFPPGRLKRPTLILNGETLDIFPLEVWTHFRNSLEIRKLGHLTGLEIEYFQAPPGTANRQAYIDLLLHRIREQARKKLILLDPDTGIEPTRANSTHVTLSDIRAIWQELSPGDRLSVYQHQPQRTGRGWETGKKQQFEEACGTSSAIYMAQMGTTTTAFPAALFVATKL